MRFAGTKKSAGSKVLALVLSLVALTACEGGGDSGLGVNLHIDKRKLSNGLQVVMVPDHTVPVVAYQTWFRVGSVDEHPGITGVSHLFEHLMFKGTPKYGPKQFFQQLEAKGAEVNAFTMRDYTVYHETFVPALFDKVVEMEADRMQNLKLDEETLNSERMVVFEERRMRTDNSEDGRMQEALWQLAYRQHPYGWPVIGYPQDLANLTLPVIISYFKAHYQPANASIVVTGDFDPDHAFAEIQKRYGAIPAQPAPKRDIENEPEQKEERRLQLYDEVASDKFAHAYHITSAMDDDSYALDVLANILFAGTSSRAYQLLVEQKNVALGVSGSSYTPAFPGLFMIEGTMKQGVPAAEAEKLLDQLIHEAQEKPVTKEEINIAIKQLTVQVVDSVRTAHGLGMLVGTMQTIYGDPNRIYDDMGKYLKVTASDVQRVARKYLIPNNRSVVIMSPKAPETKAAKKADAKKGTRS